MFSSEFCEISKNIFFIEHHWATASEQDLFMYIVFKCKSSPSNILNCIWLNKSILQELILIHTSKLYPIESNENKNKCQSVN